MISLDTKNYSGYNIIYLFMLGIVCFFMFPSHDMIFYYYPWSMNLQLSYYDGPPMIAYILRLVTIVLGHNIFAINCFGVIIAAFSSYIIIKIGELMGSRLLGAAASYMWLIYPFSTTRFIFVTLNYDCLDNLFSLATLLFTIRYIIYKKNKDLYFAGVMAGFLLLSKYTGIVLIFGILLYLLIYNRKIFSNYNLYLAILLSIFIFSPVLIWNYQHDWVSFKYQLSTHSWNTTTSHSGGYGIKGGVFYLLSDVLGVMHVILLSMIIIWIKKRKKKSTHETNVVVPLLWVVCFTYFIFWLYNSYTSHVAMNYLLPMDSLLIILAAYYFFRDKYYKWFNILTILFLVISLFMLFDRCFIKTPEAMDISKWIEVQQNYLGNKHD